MKALLTLCIALATAGAAHAQNLTIDFQSVADPIETSPFKTNSNWQVRLDYNLPTGTYAGTKIELLLPDYATHPAISVMNQAAPSAWTHSAVDFSPTQRKHTWVLEAVTTPATISGAIIVTVRADSLGYIDNTRYFTKSGTPFPFIATLSGTLDGTTPFSVTRTGEQTVVGTAEPHWQMPLVPYILMNDIIDGRNVVLLRYDLRAYVCGNAPLAGTDEGHGLPIRVNLGSKLHFVRAWWSDNDGQWPINNRTGENGTVEDSPIPYGELDHTAGGVIDARWNTTLSGGPGGSCDYTQNFMVDIAYDCEEGWDASSPDYQMNVVDGDTLVGPVTGTQVEYGGTTAQHALPPITTTNTAGIAECGERIRVEKLRDFQASPGATTNWGIYVYLPWGEVPDPNMIVVDRLPTDTTSSEGLLIYRPSHTLAPTEIYLCDLRTQPMVEYFNHASLEAYKTAGLCQLAAPHSLYPAQMAVPPASMPNVTHVVWDLPDDYTQTVDGLSYAMVFSVDTLVPRTQASPYTNCAQVVGSLEDEPVGDLVLEPFGTPNPPNNDDVAEDCATRSIPTFACPGLEFIRESNPIISPGGCGAFYFRNFYDSQGLLPENPKWALTLPPGIVVKDIVGYHGFADGDGMNGNCADGTGLFEAPFVTTNPSPIGDGVTPLAAPTVVSIDINRSPSPCAVRDYSMQYSVEFCLDAERGWVNGDPLTFSATTTGGTNLGTVQQCDTLPGHPNEVWDRTRSFAFTLSVPPEMRSFVSPVCQGDGGAAFVVDGLNTGGVALPDTSLAFALPAGTTFAGVEDLVRPAATRYEVSIDGSSWVALGGISDGSVRHVRLIGDGVSLVLPPVSDNRLAFRVLVDSSSGGGSLVGTSTMTVDVSIIAQPAIGTGEFAVGSCAAVTLIKFHDLDGNGLQGGSEPLLQEWGFVITTAEGGIAASGITGTNGSWTVNLPAGDYIASEVIPPSPDPAVPNWATTGSVEWAFTVDGVGPLTHAFGNLCDCEDSDDDLCTQRTCERATGQGRSARAQDYVCTPEQEIDCDGNSCTQNVCDPEVGCVESEFEACSPMIYFLPARDTDTNQLIAFRCEVPTDGVSAPKCATDSEGRLLTFPDQGGACSAGEPAK